MTNLTRSIAGTFWGRLLLFAGAAAIWWSFGSLSPIVSGPVAASLPAGPPAEASPAPGGRPSSAAGNAPQKNPPQDPDTKASGRANRLILRAAHALTEHHSVSARLRQRVDLFDQPMIGTGEFWQLNVGGTTYVRYEIKIPVGDQVASVQHVNDGRFLWIRKSIPAPYEPERIQTSLQRIDVQTVVKALEKHPSDSALRDLAINAGHGGLSELLVDLYRHFEFQTAYHGTLHGVPVWITTGAARASAAVGESSTWAAAQHPDWVTVALGRDDYFPYRIEFHKQQTESAPASASLIGKTKARSMLLLELFEVTIDGPLDPRGLFVYDPDEVQLVDATERYLHRLLETGRGHGPEERSGSPR